MVFKTGCKNNAKTTKKLCTVALFLKNYSFSVRVACRLYDYRRLAFLAKSNVFYCFKACLRGWVFKNQAVASVLLCIFMCKNTQLTCESAFVQQKADSGRGKIKTVLKNRSNFN